MQYSKTLMEIYKMETNGRSAKRRVAMILVNLYVLMTVLYYILLPYILEHVPFMAMVGGHINYYAFLAAYSLSDTQHPIRHAVSYLMAVIEIAYPLALLCCYLLAVLKKRYRPFWVLAVINIILLLGIIVLCASCAGVYWWSYASIWFDLIGNTLYCVAFFKISRC